MKNKDFVKKRFCRAWGKKDLTEDEEIYLNRYLIPQEEFYRIWERKMFSIFLKDLDFPNKVFSEKYRVVMELGGYLFSEDEFLILQKCLEKTGDKWLFVIENHHLNQPERLLLKFPAKIEWKDLMSGDILSREIFVRPIRNYFVFGDTELWGKYAGNDYEKPLDVIGFKDEVANVFSNYFNNFELVARTKSNFPPLSPDLLMD